MVNLSQYSMVLPEPLLDDLHELILDGFTWTSTRWLWGPSCPPHWAGTRRTLCRTSSPPAPGHRVQTVQYHVHGFFKIIVGMIWRKWLLGSTVHSVQWDVNCGGGGEGHRIQPLLVCILAFYCRARICTPFKEPRNRSPAWRNRFLGSLNVYKFGGADTMQSPISTRFLAPIDCSKIPAQYCRMDPSLAKAGQ